MTTVSIRSICLLVGFFLLAPGTATAGRLAPDVLDVRRPDALCIEGKIPPDVPPDPDDFPPAYQVGPRCGPPDSVNATAGPAWVNVTLRDGSGGYLTSIGLGLVCLYDPPVAKCPQFMIYLNS